MRLGSAGCTWTHRCSFGALVTVIPALLAVALGVGGGAAGPPHPGLTISVRSWCLALVLPCTLRFVAIWYWPPLMRNLLGGLSFLTSLQLPWPSKPWQRA